MYCSQFWYLYLKNDIMMLERMQIRATIFILNDYISDYKQHLTKLNSLLLMMIFELNDVMFFIKEYKMLSACFNINDYVSVPPFPFTNTRSTGHVKLKHVPLSTRKCQHFYFNRLP